uniref:4'-phosphopantetheinyl transferase domain-containing protein n=1 Tax=Paramoeba aestuarina TaxID=180227 RepID=A0A7S4UTT6_9EUKA|mmetsp:Transcript_9761/g.14768  ORF Transcript_9761/g.14768 Transcript_9761/m.14768 type:complete len:131 (+) Transcript_9761:145-537(+)
MLVGLGVDVCRVGRFREIFGRQGLRFAKKFLHPNELERFQMKLTKNQDLGIQFLASRWATKEAAYKAVGFNANFCDMEITSEERGQPSLKFHNKTKEKCEEKYNGLTPFVSLSHEEDVVFACVVLESKQF